MFLTKHKTPNGSRWAMDGCFLSPDIKLSTLLEMPREKMFEGLIGLLDAESAIGAEEAPIDPYQEVWAASPTCEAATRAKRNLQ